MASYNKDQQGTHGLEVYGKYVEDNSVIIRVGLSINLLSKTMEEVMTRPYQQIQQINYDNELYLKVAGKKMLLP